MMKSRSLAMAVAVAMLGSLGVSASSMAGTYVSGVAVEDTLGQAATSVDVAITGAGGSIAHVGSFEALTFNGTSFAFTPVSATSTVNETSGLITINFGGAGLSPVAEFLFTFDTTVGSVGLGSVIWHSKTASADPGGSITTAAVPEPGTMSLLGIGMVGFLSARRFLKRRKVSA